MTLIIVRVCACVSTREELTYEMLILEPRTSDDETPESEASIGTADSTENISSPPGASAEPAGEWKFLEVLIIFFSLHFVVS